jgi:hypothetical protein
MFHFNSCHIGLLWPHPTLTEISLGASPKNLDSRSRAGLAVGDFMTPNTGS